MTESAKPSVYAVYGTDMEVPMLMLFGTYEEALEFYSSVISFYDEDEFEYEKPVYVAKIVGASFDDIDFEASNFIFDL